MSTQDVVSLLSLAHRGFTLAVESDDEMMRRQCIHLAAKALAHPDAGLFFGALQLVHDELPFGNDPDIENNGNGIMDPEEESEEEAEEEGEGEAGMHSSPPGMPAMSES